MHLTWNINKHIVVPNKEYGVLWWEASENSLWISFSVAVHDGVWFSW